MRRLLLLACLPACGKVNDVTGGITTGGITSANRVEHVANPDTAREVTRTDHMNGIELRAYVAGDVHDLAVPNAWGFAVRGFGEGSGVQTSAQAGWAYAWPVGRSTIFARLMFDLLSWTEVGEETTLSGLSPTADVGIAPFGHGVCISASSTWDVRLNDPDRALVGAFVGVCAGAFGR